MDLEICEQCRNMGICLIVDRSGRIPLAHICSNLWFSSGGARIPEAVYDTPEQWTF